MTHPPLVRPRPVARHRPRSWRQPRLPLPGLVLLALVAGPRPTGAGPPALGPGSGPVDITAAPDGSLRFTEWNAGRVGRITPRGEIAKFSRLRPTTPERRRAQS